MQAPLENQLRFIRVIKLIESFLLAGFVSLVGLVSTIGFGFSTVSPAWAMLGVVSFGLAVVLTNARFQTRSFYQSVWAVRLMRILDILLVLFYAFYVWLSVSALGRGYSPYFILIPLIGIFLKLSFVFFHLWAFRILGRHARSFDVPVPYESAGDPSLRKFSHWIVFLVLLTIAVFTAYHAYVHDETKKIFRRHVANPIPKSAVIRSATYYGWLDISVQITFELDPKELDTITAQYTRQEKCPRAAVGDMCWEKKTLSGESIVIHTPATRTVRFFYHN